MQRIATVHQVWEDLRRRRRLLVLSWLAFLPIALCSGVLAKYSHHEWIFIAGGVLSFAAMFAAGVYLGAFTCPRCGSLFFVALYPRSWRAAFTRACTHCGLHTYAPADEIAQQT